MVPVVPRLLLEQELGVAGDPGAEVGRQRDRLVERVGVQALGMALGGGHRLDAGAADVVEHVLRGQAPAAGLAVGAQAEALGVLRLEVAHQPCPQGPRGAHLGDLHEEVHPDRPEEAQPRREVVDVEAGPDAGTEVLHAVGQRVGELEVGGRPGLLHVVAGDRDRVEPRHVLGGVAEDVTDDPHARRRRVDVGVADHELLEDVVLDGPRQLLGLDPLLLGRGDVERHDRQHRAVHGHADAHLVERDAVEQGARVVDGVDRHPGHPDVTADAGMVGVVATVGGQVEGDAEALLAGREVAPVERVGLLGGREAGVLPDRPGLGGVHRRVGAAEVGRETRARCRARRGPRGRARRSAARSRCPRATATEPRRSSRGRPVGGRSTTPVGHHGQRQPGEALRDAHARCSLVRVRKSIASTPSAQESSAQSVGLPGHDHPSRAGRAQGGGGRLAPLGVGRVGAGQADDALAGVGRHQVVDPGRWHRRRRPRPRPRPAGWWRTRPARCGPRPGPGSPGRRVRSEARLAAPRRRRRSGVRRQRLPSRVGRVSAEVRELAEPGDRSPAGRDLPVALGGDGRDQGGQVRPVVEPAEQLPAATARSSVSFSTA